MPAYQPPFQLTQSMTVLVADIVEPIGAWKVTNRGALMPELRRGIRIRIRIRIRSLRALLAIANSLDEAIAVEAPVQTAVGKRERTPGAILSTLRSKPELRYIGPKKGGRGEVL